MSNSQTERASLMDDFSLEITGKDGAAVAGAAANIPAGTRINVTFLGNEDLDLRVRAAQAVQAAGFIPVPHIAARRVRSAGEFREILQALQEAGVSERLFLIAGDPAEPEGPFLDALSLINAEKLADFGVNEVGISGYPEGHPDIPDAKLKEAFTAKIAAIAEQQLQAVVLTQFAFDVDAVVRWIRSVRREGYQGLIRIGTPGPAGIKRLLGYARRFGIGSSAGIVRKYGFSLTNLMGTAGPDKFLRGLQEQLDADPTSGQVGLHFYTFGGLNATAEWAEEFTAKLEGQNA